MEGERTSLFLFCFLGFSLVVVAVVVVVDVAAAVCSSFQLLFAVVAVGVAVIAGWCLGV